MLFLGAVDKVLKLFTAEELLESDRAKGIIPALEKVAPHSRKGHCMKHLAANFKTEGRASKEEVGLL